METQFVVFREQISNLSREVLAVRQEIADSQVRGKAEARDGNQEVLRQLSQVRDELDREVQVRQREARSRLSSPAGGCSDDVAGRLARSALEAVELEKAERLKMQQALRSLKPPESERTERVSLGEMFQLGLRSTRAATTGKSPGADSDASDKMIPDQPDLPALSQELQQEREHRMAMHAHIEEQFREHAEAASSERECRIARDSDSERNRECFQTSSAAAMASLEDRLRGELAKFADDLKILIADHRTLEASLLEVRLEERSPPGEDISSVASSLRELERNLWTELRRTVEEAAAGRGEMREMLEAQKADSDKYLRSELDFLAAELATLRAREVPRPPSPADSETLSGRLRELEKQQAIFAVELSSASAKEAASRQQALHSIAAQLGDLNCVEAHPTSPEESGHEAPPRKKLQELIQEAAVGHSRLTHQLASQKEAADASLRSEIDRLEQDARGRHQAMQTEIQTVYDELRHGSAGIRADCETVKEVLGSVNGDLRQEIARLGEAGIRGSDLEGRVEAVEQEMRRDKEAALQDLGAEIHALDQRLAEDVASLQAGQLSAESSLAARVESVDRALRGELGRVDEAVRAEISRVTRDHVGLRELRSHLEKQGDDLRAELLEVSRDRGMGELKSQVERQCNSLRSEFLEAARDRVGPGELRSYVARQVESLRTELLEREDHGPGVGELRSDVEFLRVSQATPRDDPRMEQVEKSLVELRAELAFIARDRLDSIEEEVKRTVERQCTSLGRELRGEHSATKSNLTALSARLATLDEQAKKDLARKSATAESSWRNAVARKDLEVLRGDLRGELESLRGNLQTIRERLEEGQRLDHATFSEQLSSAEERITALEEPREKAVTRGELDREVKRLREALAGRVTTVTREVSSPTSLIVPQSGSAMAVAGRSGQAQSTFSPITEQFSPQLIASSTAGPRSPNPSPSRSPALSPLSSPSTPLPMSMPSTPLTPPAPRTLSASAASVQRVAPPPGEGTSASTSRAAAGNHAMPVGGLSAKLRQDASPFPARTDFAGSIRAQLRSASPGPRTSGAASAPTLSMRDSGDRPHGRDTSASRQTGAGGIVRLGSGNVSISSSTGSVGSGKTASGGKRSVTFNQDVVGQ